MIVEYVRAIFLLTIVLSHFTFGLYLTAYKIVNQKAGNTYLIDFVLLHDASNVICLCSEYWETNQEGLFSLFIYQQYQALFTTKVFTKIESLLYTNN